MVALPGLAAIRACRDAAGRRILAEPTP